MENNTQNHSSSQRPAYEAPELEVALVAGPGVRTDYVHQSDEADTYLSGDSLGLG